MLVVIESLGFIFGAIALSWAAYFGMRALLAGRADETARDVAGGLVRGIAAVHGLILAFVFSQEVYEHQRMRNALISEAAAVGDIFYDIGRYGASRQHEIRTALVDYVRHVVSVEWDELGRSDRLSQHAWDLREAFYGPILDLQPQTPREQALRDHMIAQAQLISELRWQREAAAHDQLAPAFWFAIVMGLLMVSALFFTYPPNLTTLVLMSFYSGFMGLLMFFIFALSNPFAEPGRMPPDEFEHMFVGEFAEMLRAGRE